MSLWEIFTHKANYFYISEAQIMLPGMLQTHHWILKYNFWILMVFQHNTNLCHENKFKFIRVNVIKE